jgi:hypothetical protein
MTPRFPANSLVAGLVAGALFFVAGLQAKEKENTSVRAALQSSPEEIKSGQRARLTFLLTDSSGKPLNSLVTHHARKVHVVIVGEDMRVFGHIHPEDFGQPIRDGKVTVFFTFPHGGTYLIVADFMTPDGPHSARFTLDVAGRERSLAAASRAAAPEQHRVLTLEGGDRYTKPVVFRERKRDDSGEYDVSLRNPTTIRANEEVMLSFRFSQDGAPVTDLRPYLAAPMHLAIVKDDLMQFLHGHGTLGAGGGASENGHASQHHGEGHGRAHDHRAQTVFGPEVVAKITFPEEGTYYVFGQAAHEDKMIVSRFAIEVQPRSKN